MTTVAVIGCTHAGTFATTSILAGFTIDQLANVDFLFQPNFDKPVYYVGAVAMKARLSKTAVLTAKRNPGVMGAGERKERRRKRLSYAACSAVITYNNTSFNATWALAGNCLGITARTGCFLFWSRFTGSP